MKTFNQLKTHLIEAKIGQYVRPWTIEKTVEGREPLQLKSHLYPNRMTAEMHAKQLNNSAQQGITYKVIQARVEYKTRILTRGRRT